MRAVIISIFLACLMTATSPVFVGGIAELDSESEPDPKDYPGNLPPCNDPDRIRPGPCIDTSDFDECVLNPGRCEDMLAASGSAEPENDKSESEQETEAPGIVPDEQGKGDDSDNDNDRDNDNDNGSDQSEGGSGELFE